MYAIIETGGKQYRVRAGDTIWVERLEASEGDTVEFERVFALRDDDGRLVVGTPVVEGACVKARVVEHGKAPRIRVFKFKSKVKYRRMRGHRQPFTRVNIEEIKGPAA